MVAIFFYQCYKMIRKKLLKLGAQYLHTYTTYIKNN